MSHTTTMLYLKRLLMVVAALVLVAILGIVAFLLLGPGTFANKMVLANFVLGRSVGAPAEQVIRQRLHVPPGFSINVYASELSAVRFLRFTSGGELLVSLPRAGQIVLLERSQIDDGRAGGRRVLLDHLDRPHGLDIHDGWLYVGENTAVGRVRFDEQHGKLLGKYERVVTGLTGNGNHWTKTVRIGPDGKLYLAQGSSCNVCEEDDPRRATIMQFNADGSDGKIYATGLRNSVGIDWAPWDNTLYATTNGRDLLGDDYPPEPLNRIEQGGFYGWPYINGFGDLDPDLGKGKETLLDKFIRPVHAFRPHNAPLGIHFLTRGRLPPDYERTALVALHGSWNRTVPDGYKVVALRWREDGSIEERDFLTGFLEGNDAIGRPVDVTEGPDGAIYVSDDYGGVVYRIAYAP